MDAADRAERAEAERLRIERMKAHAAAHPLSAEDRALAARTAAWLRGERA